LCDCPSAASKLLPPCLLPEARIEGRQDLSDIVPSLSVAFFSRRPLVLISFTFFYSSEFMLRSASTPPSLFSIEDALEFLFIHLKTTLLDFPTLHKIAPCPFSVFTGAPTRLYPLSPAKRRGLCVFSSLFFLACLSPRRPPWSVARLFPVSFVSSPAIPDSRVVLPFILPPPLNGGSSLLFFFLVTEIALCAGVDAETVSR